jgi:pimeloyl-ACP methyl ester carboxylesterase
MSEITLPQGTIRYRDTGGGAGETIVLIHGVLVDGRLWRKVVPLLEGEHRVVVPDLPLGAHKTAMNASADQSPLGVAKLVADFLEALDLKDVTLVGNDTGGAICQLVATRHGDRVGRLVLTPCDAYDNFLPKLFKPLQWGAKVPPVLYALVQPLRLAPLRKLPIAFGWLTKRPLDKDIEADWIRPFFADKGVRRDAIALLAAIDSADTEQAARDLASFDKPALIAWAPEDKVFPLEHGRRLAATIPNARFETIEDSRTFVSEDQPERVAQLIRDFVRETAPAAARA